MGKLKTVLAFFIAMQTCLFSENSYITCWIGGQLGNNFFEVATACALAWDNNATAYFPDLIGEQGCNIPLNYRHVFFRCNVCPPESEISVRYEGAPFNFKPIPFHSKMRISGLFQSEKYFAHHRERLLKLFAPHPADLQYMQRKYQWLMDHPHTVGLQLRYYHDDPSGVLNIQHGRDYVEKAMSLFPPETLFIVSTNNLSSTKRIIPKEAKVYYIEDEPHYINLYLLSYCKHNIITNSTFGWWGAWLNQNPNKIVVVPEPWFNPQSPYTDHEIVPDEWIQIEAKWGAYENPTTYE